MCVTFKNTVKRGTAAKTNLLMTCSDDTCFLWETTGNGNIKLLNVKRVCYIQTPLCLSALRTLLPALCDLLEGSPEGATCRNEGQMALVARLDSRKTMANMHISGQEKQTFRQEGIIKMADTTQKRIKINKGQL
jgi:hypothetical protein